MGLRTFFLGNQPNIQHITPMPSGKDNPEMDQWVSYENRGYIAGPWSVGDSGDAVLPKGKYTRAHNPDHRAFLCDSHQHSLLLLLPRAGATVRYHLEAFCPITCACPVPIVFLHSFHPASPPALVAFLLTLRSYTVFSLFPFPLSAQPLTSSCQYPPSPSTGIRPNQKIN